MINYLFYILFSILILSSLVAGIISIFENEKRASLIFFGISLCVFGFMLIIRYLPKDLAYHTILTSMVIIILLFILFTFPIPRTKQIRVYQPADRIDERNIMFSRAALTPKTNSFDKFYSNRPDLKPIDDNWRKNPGLLGNQSKYYDLFRYTAAESSFQIIAENRKQQFFKAAVPKKSIDINALQKYLDPKNSPQIVRC